MSGVFSAVVVVTYKWGKGSADLGNDLHTGNEEMGGNIILENMDNSYHGPGIVSSDFIYTLSHWVLYYLGTVLSLFYR